MFPIMFILFLLCLYPIIKLIIYLPMKNIFKNQQNSHKRSLFLTILVSLILALIIYLYSLTFETRGELNYAALIFMLITYGLALVSSIILLVIKKEHPKTQNDIKESTAEQKSKFETVQQQDEDKESLGIDKIVLFSIVGALILFLIFVIYFSWALTNT